jgi:hypothetical protein
MQYYITGNGFIRYTNNNWITSTQIFETKHTLQGLVNDGYQQVSKR